MKKYNALLIVWTIVVVIIFGLLITVGYIYKSKIQKYKDYEEVIKLATNTYINSNHISLDEDSQITLTVKELIDGGYINRKKVIKSCDGNVLVKFKNSYKIYPSIKCKYYSTKTKK